MKAAIYNPYLDTLGGGERYTLSFAKVLSDSGIDVDIEWKDKNIKEKLSERFGLKLSSNIKIVDLVNRGENYDMCFWVSDGSIPMLRSSKNYIHFQVPFHDVNGRSLLNKMKLYRVDKIICNSKFTKEVIDKEYGVDSIVLYPPIDTSSFKPKRKIDQICYVARFSNLTQNKGHDVLIEQFRNLIQIKKFKDWKLVLAGGVEIGADKYLKDLKYMANGLNVEFVESPSFGKIKEIFGQSKIFWSGSGFEVDENKNPEKTEHFGMTLVESMSAGCVPVAYKAGGHKEIVKNGVNGFLWDDKEDLINLTEKLLTDKGLLQKISKEAISSSRNFDFSVFAKSVLQIIK
jgi:glycosyltransferase involved in cell wall biosynthesis